MFSNSTILEIAKCNNFKTHDEIDRFALTFELSPHIKGEYLKQKETSIAKYLLSHQNDKGPNGSSLAVEILEYSVKNGNITRSCQKSELINALERDGYELTDVGVRRVLPKELAMLATENKLVAILRARGFIVALGHYEQAIAAHGRGEWAAANAQLRTFVEEFFNRTQELICPGSYNSSQDRKAALAKCGFFVSEHNEFLNYGNGFVEGFWKRLHSEGSHPGLSERSHSTFRLHLVILVIQYFAARLDDRFNLTIPK